MADPRDEERGGYGAGDRKVSELTNPPRSLTTQKSPTRDGQDGGTP
jgi:hypothetical protein